MVWSLGKWNPCLRVVGMLLTWVAVIAACRDTDIMLELLTYSSVPALFLT
jgi:hypothetical protein